LQLVELTEVEKQLLERIDEQAVARQKALENLRNAVELCNMPITADEMTSLDKTKSPENLMRVARKTRENFRAKKNPKDLKVSI
jgi:DNA-binding protein H-NS